MKFCLGLTLCTLGLFVWNCGDSTTTLGGGKSIRGYTDCGAFMGGPVTCQPGQYCEDMEFSRCELGCLSNDNCTESQNCQKETGDDIGSCQNIIEPPPPPPSTDNSCEETCKKMVQCGLIDSWEEPSCTTGCGLEPEEKRKIQTDCILAWQCLSGIPSCLAPIYECGPAYPCPDPDNQICEFHICEDSGW